MPGTWYETRMPWEWTIPVLGWSVPIYSSSYLIVPLAFLVQHEAAPLPRLAFQGWLSIALIIPIYLCLPLTAAFRPPSGETFFDVWLKTEQQFCAPAVAAWPSFHVVWGLFAAQALAGHGAARWWWAWAGLNALACLTSGMHSVADVAAGVLVWVVLREPAALWTRLLQGVQRQANSWRAWRLGPLRIMNHFAWPALGGICGVLGIAALAGPKVSTWTLLVGGCGFVGAALMGQVLSGAKRLSRPFGYFGFAAGAGVGLAVVSALSGPWQMLAGAICAMGPWVQALGRMRCLVQGCCHGGPGNCGIVVQNPHSRVVCISALGGVTIHPTQLYSMLYNLPLGLFLLRLWFLHAPALAIAGLYLVLSGFGRFVEQAYRGERQTPIACGLPIYQWFGLVSVIGGLVLAVVDSPAASSPAVPGWSSLLAALGFGLIAGIAMSVDFPESTKRFARLSG